MQGFVSVRWDEQKRLTNLLIIRTPTTNEQT